MLKKISALLLSAVLTAGIFSGCERSDLLNTSDEVYANFTMPANGEEIAVITVKDYGTLKVKLFPENAPKGVENFVGLAKMGYYDGLTFHRIVKDFCIQGGDPEGVGTGGTSIWGEEFAIEPSDNLSHFKGALSYARPEKGGNSSQFFFAMGSMGDVLDQAYFDFLKENGLEFSKEVIEKYIEVGGAPQLDGQYTVFGQVFEGLDILDKINTVEVDEYDMPSEKVIIESVKIEAYKA